MGFCYRVDLTRLVSEPLYGPDAYSTDRKTREFPFGKGKEYPTGKDALAAAEVFAKSMMDKASSISVWRMCGGRGSGEYLKEDRESRFATGWGEL